MKNKRFVSEWASNDFIILDYPSFGMVYIYICKNGKCMYDYLAFNVEGCKWLAFEEWGVPLNLWREEPFSDSLSIKQT